MHAKTGARIIQPDLSNGWLTLLNNPRTLRLIWRTSTSECAVPLGDCKANDELVLTHRSIYHLRLTHSRTSNWVG